jgi:cysteine desulfurase family protein
MAYMEVYLNNASTSLPKPPAMMEAMVRYNNEVGVNTGRGSYPRALESARIISDTRIELAELFNIEDNSRIIFTLNCTQAINIAMWGLLNEGDHVIISSVEHNAVVRPLMEINKRRGVEYTIVDADDKGRVKAEDYKQAFKKNTKLMILNAGSNVCGTVNPVDEVGAIARETDVIFMVDGAQIAGCHTVDVKRSNIDIFAFPGHKGLMGPAGIGGLFISEDLDVETLYQGGTGSESHLEFQPDFYPDKMEPGTPNSIGIAGFLASLEFIKATGVENIRDKKLNLTAQFLAGLMEIDGVTYYGSNRIEDQLGVLSIVFEEIDCGKVADILFKDYGIMVRNGLHCAPLAHKTLGTYKTGTVRFSIGYFNNESHIEHALDSIKDLRSRY